MSVVNLCDYDDLMRQVRREIKTFRKSNESDTWFEHGVYDVNLWIHDNTIRVVVHDLFDYKRMEVIHTEPYSKRH